jgi:ATP-dependent Clp protease ATP-binding subunit ClpC
LWALGTQKGCIGAEILNKVGVKQTALRALVGAKKTGVIDPALPPEAILQLSDEAKRIVEKAVLTANVYGHRYVGTEHLLSGVVQVEQPTLDAFFTNQHIDMKELKQQLSIVLKSTSRFPELADTISQDAPVLAGVVQKEKLTTHENATKEKMPALEFFARELTTKEIQSKIDPVIGRENEIERVMEILSRRTKNNPLLLGEPGVGKTAIVEGLAKRIVERDVPPSLTNKRIFALDMALVIAGTMYRGEFEGRLRQIMEEIKVDDDIILFIDEVHTLVGAGAASGAPRLAGVVQGQMS